MSIFPSITFLLLQAYGVFAEYSVCGIIKVPEPFYDYAKKDKAAVAARWASETATRAAVEAEKKASIQAAVQQATAKEAAVQAVQAAKTAAKAATRAAKRTERTEKAAGDKATIKQAQEVAQVRQGYM